MSANLIYLDSSVALRTILDVPERKRLQSWMDETQATFVSSRLLRTEITRETHTVAESIERHIKTLDALHIATALLVGEVVTVATHDTTMLSVAEHLGLRATDPVAGT